MITWIKTKSDAIICGVVYGIGLFMGLRFMEIVSDRALEYRQYLAIINRGGIFLWNQADDLALVSSSLFATWLPAKISLLTGINARILFEVFPCLFYALMPAFVYLISRKYFNKVESLFPSALVLFSFYFAYYPSIGRTSIAFGFLAGLVWAIIQQRYMFVAVFTLLLALAYYGSSYYMLFVLVFVLFVILVVKLFYKVKQKTSVRGLGIICFAFVVLIASIGYWYEVVNPSTGNMMAIVIKDSVGVDLSIKSASKDTVTDVANAVVNSEVAVADNTAIALSNKATTKVDTKPKEVGKPSFWSIDGRDVITQSILGATFTKMKMPQKIEFISSWLIVLLITLGMVLAFKRKQLTLTHRILALAMYGATIATMALPMLGETFGTVKSGFSGFVSYAPCYVIGCNQISEKLRMNKYILPSIVLGVYGLCVSGIMHSFFGIVK